MQKKTRQKSSESKEKLPKPLPEGKTRKRIIKKKAASGKSKQSETIADEKATREKPKADHPFKKFEKKKFTKPEEKANTFFKEKFIKKKEPRKPKEVTEVFTSEEKLTDDTRLNKYLAHAGIASRRKADELIKEGRVQVNGTVVTEMGYKVKLKDEITFDGKAVTLEKKYYVLLNKPKDFITTVNDERGRKTVMDLIRSAYVQMKARVKPRLYPVGRLDRNTTGVLLITNDGELAQKLTHPSTEVKKVYHVVLDKKLTKEDFDKIAEGGVVLEDGIAEVDVIAYPNPKSKAEVGLEIHTGKNRFVRRLFEALGYQVEKLDRVFFAGLTKKELPRGRWRFLTEEEVRNLKYFHK